MPIKGYTDVQRLPRIGKIHLGVKQQSTKSDALYPKAVEWFEVHEDPATSGDAAAAFREVYGERPTELDIIFPADDETTFADAYYKAYSQSWGLICKGDGESASARWDARRDGARPPGVESGTWANRETQEWVSMQIPCLAKDCPMMKAKRCRAVMNLQFLLPYVAGVGVWQVDTGSWYSIVNVQGNIRMVKAVTGGHIRGVPLKLRRVSKQVTPPGEKTKTVYVLDIYNPLSLAQLLQWTERLQAGGPMLLPSPDDEMPEDLYPPEADEDGVVIEQPAVEEPRDLPEPPQDDPRGDPMAVTEADLA